MCLLLVNQAILDSFANLTQIGVNEDDVYQKKLIRFADAADTKYPGPLDNSSGCLKHMPDDLKHIRHYRVGRHRIFLTGHHKNCHYHAWYIKEFKRDGRDTEGSKPFNETLRTVLNSPANNLLTIDEDDNVLIENRIEPLD